MALEDASHSKDSVPSRSAADRVELEAAEALAGLAGWALKDSVSESAAKWGSKGKRVRRRVKSDWPPSDPEDKLLDQLPTPVDYAEDQATLAQQSNYDVSDKPNHDLSSNSDTKGIKVENLDDVFERKLMSATRDTPIGGGRSRQNLSEVEKEARRLRRILANRESARQTIRRRQALCEDLRQRAADLTRENENLIREKEMALTQYQTLEKANRDLKREMDEFLKAERAETSVDVRKCDPKIPTTNTPMFSYNQHPYPPICWPSVYQSSSHAVQSHQGFQSPAERVSSNIAVSIPTGIPSSHNQQSPLVINCQHGPLYIVPCPWFAPHPEDGKGFRPQLSGCTDLDDDEVCLNNSCIAVESSSRTISHVESKKPSSPLKVENSKEVRAFDLNAFPVKHNAEVEICGSQLVENYEATNMIERNSGAITSTSAGIASTLVKDPLPDYFHDGACHVEAVVSTLHEPAINAFPEKKESINYVIRERRDQQAATLARRRRRELTKLKNLHGRRCWMQC